MKNKMNEETANLVYDILVEECKAPESMRDAFVCHHINELHQVCEKHAYRSNEWRFQGNLGFGGKFWQSKERWYVDCYSEDMADMQKPIIDKANKRLSDLKEKSCEPFTEPARYLVLIEGVGIGCDHSIACNLKWEFIEADSPEELKQKLKDEVFDVCGTDRIESIELFDITHVQSQTIEYETLFADEIEEQEREESEQEQQTDEAELERLRKKLGK